MADEQSRGRPRRTIGVLFVCTGNICRSPTAAGVFRTMVSRVGLSERFHIDSCGTFSGHVGRPPDPRAQDHALRRGYDIGEIRARLLRADDFVTFDHLLAMDEGQLQVLRRMATPPTRERARLFLDFAPNLPTREVPDPYYGEAADFERALDLIERGAASLLVAVRKELK
ncbi:MAG TPA: low molecular weight protein-tyrosine-phosphatase [Alphaproteobacteria bacterium]|nr:low molecular weight protein-tyrosine-phosphatase [Alphaproteobacteria bacterium]